MTTETNGWMTEWMSDPVHHAAYEAAVERQRREIQRPCRIGCCVEFYDPVTRTVTGGWGSVGCPCQDPPRAFSRKGQPRRRWRR